MKIAIDIRRMNEFGVGTYTRNIIRALARLDRENKYFLLGPQEKVNEIGKLPENFKSIPVLGPDTVRGYVQCQEVVSRLGCDLVHVPHLFWLPRHLPCPYVLTVHDMLEHMYRARSGSGLKRSLHFYLTRRVVQNAARIFAVSRFTKSEVEKLFGIDPSRIEVIYNAIDHRFLSGHASDADRQFLAERYQVTYPFLLYAGRISPHKNLVRIIEAFSALKADLTKHDLYPDLKLIIIGDELSKHPDLRRTVVRGGVQNDVRFLGFVPIEVLRIFYDAAKVFVFPSLYEGFGIPVAEALACGVPVVTSNISSLPEAGATLALTVDPTDTEAMAEAIYKALTDEAVRERCRSHASSVAQRFSAQTMVEQTIAVYEQAAALQASQRH